MKGDGLGLDRPGSTQAFALKNYVTVDKLHDTQLYGLQNQDTNSTHPQGLWGFTSYA